VCSRQSGGFRIKRPHDHPVRTYRYRRTHGVIWIGIASLRGTSKHVGDARDRVSRFRFVSLGISKPLHRRCINTHRRFAYSSKIPRQKELLVWVAESGKNLTTIYVTHAHGDHFFGLKLLLDRFPNAKAFATASVVAAAQNQIKPDFVKSFWEPRFPGQVPSQLVAPEVLAGDTLYLEGEGLKVVELGHTDTVHTTALQVPSIGLVISGDAVYNNTHPYLAECDEKARGEWLRALDKIEGLHPRAVIAGHGVLDPDSSPGHIEETRGYIHDFNASMANTSTAMDLYEKMLTLYPNRVNPGSLWATAKAVKPAS
jgi:glyoxylase-like metal-dependent hydrolase (beta-lactamase superfamily II)